MDALYAIAGPRGNELTDLYSIFSKALGSEAKLLFEETVLSRLQVRSTNPSALATRFWIAAAYLEIAAR
jgi:hypothetical protein